MKKEKKKGAFPSKLDRDGEFRTQRVDVSHHRRLVNESRDGKKMLETKESTMWGGVGSRWRIGEDVAKCEEMKDVERRDKRCAGKGCGEV